MARTIDPYDDEYEGVAEPLVYDPNSIEAKSYEHQRNMRRMLANPEAYPGQTYTPDYTPEVIAPGGLAGLPLAALRPSTYIGQGGGVGGKGGGRADNPFAFDDFGNEDPFGGGLQYKPPVPQATPTTAPTLPSPQQTATPTFPAAAPTAPTFPVTPNAFDLAQFGGEYTQFNPLLSNFVNQYTAPMQAGAFMEPTPEVTGRLQNLLTTGGRIPETMQAFGAGLAGLPTGGVAPTQDILSQFITGNIGGANIPVQTAANQQLQNLIQGAGISPEYAQAARQTIFDPSMEALQGRLNQMGGGVADLSGGLSAELQRRAERDFQNQMLMAGQQNLPNLLQLGLAGGQQQFGQAAEAARQAAQREQMLGAFGEGGITQGLNFMQQQAAVRANQEAQLAGLVRAIMTEITEQQPGILGQLIASSAQFGGDLLPILFPPAPKDPPLRPGETRPGVFTTDPIPAEGTTPPIFRPKGDIPPPRGPISV